MAPKVFPSLPQICRTFRCAPPILLTYNANCALHASQERAAHKGAHGAQQASMVHAVKRSCWWA
eukprot:4389752-Pleurochrysis_carterae.AAC.1